MSRALPILTFLVSVGATLSARAEPLIYVSDEGGEYVATANANGAVLQSRYPKVRQRGLGVDRRYVRGLDKMYFGRNCDAVHEVFGLGSWGWANDGFGADFPDFSIRFPGQEVLWTEDLNCRW